MEISCYFQSVKNVLLLYWSLIMYIYGKLYFTLNKWKYYSKKILRFFITYKLYEKFRFTLHQWNIFPKEKSYEYFFIIH